MTESPRRMKIITIANHKGGVGKTTAAVNLAYGLAKMGKETLLVDLDRQFNATKIYCKSADSQHAGRLFMEQNCISDVTWPAYINDELVRHLHIIPASAYLTNVERTLGSKINGHKMLKKQLLSVDALYDYVIIDCAPGLDVFTLNGLYCADEIVIPVESNGNDIDGITIIITYATEVKETNQFKYRILRNCFDIRNSGTNILIDTELENYPCFKTVIRRSEAINQAYFKYEPVAKFKPGGAGEEDFESLTKEVVNG